MTWLVKITGIPLTPPQFMRFNSLDHIHPPLRSIYDCSEWNVLNKSVIAAALLAFEPIECETAFWVKNPPMGNIEAEGFGGGGQVVPLETQALGTEPLKSSQLENVSTF